MDSPYISVVVEPTGDAPSLVNPGDIPAQEGTILNITLEVDDPDLPSDTFIWSDSSDWIDIDSESGAIVWTPGPYHVGSHIFTVTVTDWFGLNDTIVIRIIVENVNNPPTIVSDLTMDAVQDQPATYVVVGDDPDLPHGDALTYFAVSNDLLVEYDMDTGIISFTPANDNVPTLEITIGVRDSMARVLEATLVVNVANVNDPPVMNPLNNEDVEVGQTASYMLVFDDPDLHITLTTPESLTITHDGGDAFAPDSEGLIEFDAVFVLVGEHVVTYTVTDSGGLSDSIEVTWVIVSPNGAPAITSETPDNVEAIEDVELSVQLTAVDPNGDTFTWNDTSDVFDIDPTDGIITFTPTQEDVGTHHVKVTVTDTLGGSSSWIFELVVVEVNDAPLIGAIGPDDGSTFKEGATITFTGSATDEEEDPLTYKWFKGEEEIGSGEELKVSDLPEGTHTIRLVVSDGTSSDEGSIQVTVEAEEDGGSSSILLLGIIIGILALALFALKYVSEGRQGGGAGEDG
jgi:hypothetical protein